MTMPSSLRLKKQPGEPQSSPMPKSLRPKKIEEKPEQPTFNDEDFISDEDVQRNTERAQAQLFSRTAESFLGAPGDIASFVSGLFGKEQKLLPSSQTFRNLSEKATGGYTAPQSEFEESVGNVFSDIGSMAIPGSGHYSIARNIGIPIVGGLVKEGLKYGNADEKNQAYGKVGTMVALDLLSRRTGGAKKYSQELFKKAEQAVPEGTQIDATGLSKALHKVERDLSAGGSRPTTKKALEKVTEIQKEIADGTIDAKRLAAYRPSINEAIDELGGFQLEVPKKLKPQAIRNLNKVKEEVISSLYEYGEKFNPDYLALSKAANESYAAISKSNLIANFIKDKVKYTPKSEAVKLLFSLAGPAAAIGAFKTLSPATTAAGIGGYGAYQGVKILHQVINSPVLRKYYQNVLKESSAGNASGVAKNLKALDLHLKDENLDDLQ